jgi:hypothetical protein
MPANVFRTPLGSRRGNTDDRLYTRAVPEKVAITETYSVTQVIASNPDSKRGEPAGRVEIVVPYDGGDHFTRQAVGDVERAIAARADGQPHTAIMGHLLIADHRRTDLYRSMGHQYSEVGVIPLEVPVTAADGTTARLTSDRLASLLSYDYTPMRPELDPVSLEVQLFDPDMLDVGRDWFLGAFDVDPAALLERLTRKAFFTNKLLLTITVRLTLPIKKGGLVKPVVKRVSIGWPTVTSIATTELVIITPDDSKPGIAVRDYQSWPIRYNPVARRLEWEDVVFLEPEELPDGLDDHDVDNRIYRSAPMQLIIGHPGELFQEPQLTVHAEVEVPEYLLSGVEARLYGATGNRVTDGTSGPLPELTTHLNATATLQLDDAFADREFAPYHQVVFDRVEPGKPRIDDIVAELRNAQFDVDPYKEVPGSTDDPGSQKWVLRARRPTDSLGLTVAVEGKRQTVEEHVGDQSLVWHGETRSSGWIKLSMRGELPRDHQELTRQMNQLQAALRERYRQQQGV